MPTAVLNRLPLALVCLRFLLAPVMLLLAVYWPLPMAFALCLAAALLSDFLDGVIARRLGIATAGLRRLDSCADTVFWLAALMAVWMRYPQVVQEYRFPLLALLLLEAVRYILDFLKFRREASYHMWSAKLWSLALFLAFVMVLVAGQASPWVGIAIGLGLVSDAEGLLISLVLPRWQHDVPTLVHAWRHRTHPSTDDRGGRPLSGS